MATKAPRWIAAAALAALLVPLPAAAQTLYKLIDRNGKVTYVQEPPKDYDGQVIPVQIDPKANTATLPKYTPPPAPPKAGEATPTKDVVAQARERLEKAQRALANARDNPAEGDVQRVGKVGGGTRPVFSPDYQQRLESLEREVREAEEALKKAERR